MKKSNLVPNTETVKKEMEKCFADLGALSKEEVDHAMQLISVESLAKGTLILQKGEVSTKSYSVISGCVRQYYLVDGEEKTTFFYTEGDSIFAMNSGAAKTPSKFFLSCVEPTMLSVITYENQKVLYARFPKLETLSRAALQEELAHYQELLANYIVTTPEERYLNLLRFRPELLNRVPQYQLASYLGVVPESLSRIRKRISLG